MTNEEFSNAFDTLLNSYNTSPQFGDASSKLDIVLDEYEKSVFLTLAQDLIIKGYFGVGGNTISIDDSIRRLIDFSNLIRVYTIESTDKTNFIKPNETNGVHFNDRSFVVNINTGNDKGKTSPILFILNELVNCDSKVYLILPISYDEYSRLMSRAYQFPLKRLCWRLIEDSSSTLKLMEIIPNNILYTNLVSNSSPTATYKIRYVRRPAPIILEGVAGSGLVIDGISTTSLCELDPIIHYDILYRAFELAVTSKAGGRPSKAQPTNEL